LSACKNLVLENKQSLSSATHRTFYLTKRWLVNLPLQLRNETPADEHLTGAYRFSGARDFSLSIDTKDLRSIKFADCIEPFREGWIGWLTDIRVVVRNYIAALANG
jgi:hypothetical protein